MDRPYGLGRQFVEVELESAVAGLRVQGLRVGGVVRIEVMLQLPGVGDSVAVAVGSSLPVHGGRMPTHLALVGDELAFDAKGEKIAHQARIDRVAAERISGLAGALP